MKLKKIIALSSAFVLLAGTGLTIGLTIGLDEKTPPVVESGLTGSTGAKMAWSDLVTNNVVNVEDGKLNVDNAEVEKICPNDTTFTLEIPEDAGVTKIGFDAFNECMKLTSIKIASTVTEIDTDAFYNCDNLTTVSFATGSNLTTIGYGAFTYCDKLVNIQIPSSVTRIDQSAFIGCSSLETINIPSGVSTIESHVFKDCVSLSTVIIEGTVTEIEPYAFYNCSSLTTIDNIIQDANIIQNTAFTRCDKLETVNFGSSLKEIQFDAFMDCQSLKTVNFTSNSVEFGLGVFRNCINLTNITLPVNTMAISDYMFYNCEDLSSFTVGTNVTYIGYRAFMNCFKLNLNFEDVNWLYSESDNLDNLQEITFNTENSNKLIDEYADYYFTMKCNSMVINSLDKVYDSKPVDYPFITTRDGFEGVANPSLTEVEVVWYYYDLENNRVPMPDEEIPTNVGKYCVEINYPETTDYLSFTQYKDFEITPIEVDVIVNSETEFTYDGLTKTPDFSLSVNYLYPVSDYEVYYFEKNDEDTYDVLDGNESAPTEIGDYVMRIVLVGNGANNAKFDIANNIIEKDIYFSIIAAVDSGLDDPDIEGNE